MASAEDRAHAARLLAKKKARLYRLEEQEAAYGIGTEPAILNEIEDLRRDIATLNALLEPQPSNEVQEAVRRNTTGDFDFTMLFLQNVKQNERITRVEEQVTTIAQQQNSAQLWRIDVAERLDASERARDRNMPVWRAVIVLLTIGVLLALYLAAR